MKKNMSKRSLQWTCMFLFLAKAGHRFHLAQQAFQQLHKCIVAVAEICFILNSADKNCRETACEAVRGRSFRLPQIRHTS